MDALTPRQQLAEQLAIFIRRHGGCTITSLPLGHSDHLRFEVCSPEYTLLNALKRLGFDLRLLGHSKRLDPWAATEIIRVGNPKQAHQHAAVIDICVSEVQLPIVSELKG